MSAPSDPDLLQRCADGDAAAWELLTTRYADLVYGVGWRSGLRGDDAGDLVQEVFLRLLENLRRIRDPERLAGWLAMTARREAWRMRRRDRKAAEREKARARGERDAARLPPDEVAAIEEEHAVRTAFARISGRCRRLLDALFFRTETRPYAEVAEELGVPVGSLGPTRRRCLDALKRELAALGFPPPEDVSGTGATSSLPVKRKRS